MTRGRPRHDDVLTPREWEVLNLLRDGLTNDEIAAALGISIATAKFHVGEIIGKLGVASRGEAAAWPGRPQRPYAVTPLAWLRDRLQPARAARFAGAAAVFVALLALLVLLAGVAIMDGRPAADIGALATPDSPEAVTVTQIILFAPSSTPSYREDGGSCRSSSVISREGVWRCSGGRGPFDDPCFGTPGALEVICPLRPEPNYHNAYVLELDEPLIETRLPPTVEARRPSQAWWVMTADGRMCGFKAGGTAPVVNGERVNFWCPDETGLIGYPQPGKVWTARQVPFQIVPEGTIVPETIVELRIVWR